MPGTIREKVTELDSVRRELLSTKHGPGAALGASEGDDYRLFPPPAPGEIRAFERRSGRSLPPSFREFLELANGWRGFMRGWTLVGLRRRETELFFREGLDEKILRALPDLVPEAELKTLSAREKTDPKVLSPANHHVVGIDGRGSALVLDRHRGSGAEPEVALVKYVWVQRRWPSFAALLDEAIGDATKELERLRQSAPAEPAAKTKKGTKAGKAKKTKTVKSAEPMTPKRRVVEIRPPTKTKTKTKNGKAGKPAKASKPASQKPAGKPVAAAAKATKNVAKKPAKKKTTTKR